MSKDFTLQHLCSNTKTVIKSDITHICPKNQKDNNVQAVYQDCDSDDDQYVAAIQTKSSDL